MDRLPHYRYRYIPVPYKLKMVLDGDTKLKEYTSPGTPYELLLPNATSPSSYWPSIFRATRRRQWRLRSTGRHFQKSSATISMWADERRRQIANLAIGYTEYHNGDNFAAQSPPSFPRAFLLATRNDGKFPSLQGTRKGITSLGRQRRLTLALFAGNVSNRLLNVPSPTGTRSLTRILPKGAMFQSERRLREKTNSP